jgi:hypothetical protein
MFQNLEKLNTFLKERREFSYKTFGSKEERGCEGPLTHLKKEIQELLDNPNDPMEWADCFLLLTDAADRKGHSFEDLVDFARKKLEINKARNWQPQTDGTYRHVSKDACPTCDGEGGVDSGGSTPWGSPIFIPCPSCSKQEIYLVPCEQCGEKAWDGRICHVCGMKKI